MVGWQRALGRSGARRGELRWRGHVGLILPLDPAALDCRRLGAGLGAEVGIPSGMMPMAVITVLIALNTHGDAAQSAHVTVEALFHPQSSTMTVLYRSDWSDAELKQAPAGQTVPVNRHASGRAYVQVDLPAAGMVILG